MKEPEFIHDWIGKRVLTRDVPVEIKSLHFRNDEEPYAEGVDEKGRHYKFPLSSLRLMDRPIEGVVIHGK